MSWLYINLQWGQTPLYSASFNGHDKCLELLVAAGAQVNAQQEVCVTNNIKLDALFESQWRGFHVSLKNIFIQIWARGYTKTQTKNYALPHSLWHFWWTQCRTRARLWQMHTLTHHWQAKGKLSAVSSCHLLSFHLLRTFCKLFITSCRICRPLLVDYAPM